MVPHNTMHRRALVIGYGNELRRDDGLGPYVARQLAARRIPSVRTITIHQLTPELADNLSSVQFAVFVDALMASTGCPVMIDRIKPRATWSSMSHAPDAAALLELARVVFGKTPEAWSVGVAGEDFSTGEGLSDFAKRNAVAAVAQMEALLREVIGRRATPVDHLPAEYSPRSSSSRS